jgi:hypothetical protein
MLHILWTKYISFLMNLMVRLVGGFWRGGKGILLVNCVWFIFLRRGREGI